VEDMGEALESDSED